MNLEELVENYKKKMSKTIDVLKKDFSSVRTGKANPTMIQSLKVSYYGVPTDLQLLSTISVPEPRLLLVTPFEKSLIKEIEKAIQTSGLGLQPTNDGINIRIIIPELTGERRKELVKYIRNISETKKIAIRNIRREANDNFKKLFPNMSQDDLKLHQNNIQKITDSYIKMVSDLLDEKEKEIINL